MLRRFTQDRLTGSRSVRIALASLAIALVLPPARSGATPAALSGGAGADYQTGPRSQSYRGALLFASAEATPGDLTVAAIRYDDGRLGAGTGAFANAGLVLSPALRLRVIGLRAFGDSGFDSWRLRAGPELKLHSEWTLGAYYLHLHDDSPESFNAGGLELTVPLSTEFSAQAGTSFGRWTSGETTAQGTLAGTFRAGTRLLFIGEVDVGRNVTTASSPSPSGGGGGIVGGILPGLGGRGGGSRSQTHTDRSITSTAQVGVRFLIP